MLSTLIACSKLSVQDIEKEVFEIINSRPGNTDENIISTFIDKHVGTSNVSNEDLSNIRVELKNFMYGCGDIQVDEPAIVQAAKRTCEWWGCCF